VSRLIIVSNRVSPPSSVDAANQGGLAVAISAALRGRGGIWFGWSGQETEHFTGQLNVQRNNNVTTATVDLEPQDIDEYYNGFANRTLWPLFHYRVDLAEFERGFAGGYARVNSRLADTLVPLIEPDDIVWIHDYHLIPLGQELRKRGCKNRMGFFLHIPWPPMGLLMALPDHRALVEALFAYDVVGFQTRDCLSTFSYYTSEQMGLEVSEDGIVRLDGRAVRLLACPIGIDTAEFKRVATGRAALKIREEIELSAKGRTMVIGVDRLDYSKGLGERFSGYERFLAGHPEWHEKVFLLQIAPPSRGDVASYQEIRAYLDELSGRINGEYASATWVPLRYVNRGYPRDELAGLYRAACAALVTPLRDGMNLVAKEFVASQDPENPGVLILSRFAGAAEQMKDALLINPHSPDEIADALGRAIAMPLDERIARWRSLMDGVERENVHWWMKSFVAVLTGESEPTPDEPAGAAEEPSMMTIVQSTGRNFSD
jgi:trehalose 6-phosphate synthase